MSKVLVALSMVVLLTLPACVTTGDKAQSITVAKERQTLQRIKPDSVASNRLLLGTGF
jgi:outer membrane lipoprotein SlyB